jgi:hypothetical protein
MGQIYAAVVPAGANSLWGVAGESFLVGVIATLASDLWTLLLGAVGVHSPGNLAALLGRWVAWMPRGVFIHRPITATAPIRGEAAIGLIFHYAVGIIYAALYLGIMRLGFGSEPTLTSAVVFALILLAAPWFVMQPALGFGFMAARTPNPAALRAVTFSVHTCFGIGLYLGALLAGVSGVRG